MKTLVIIKSGSSFPDIVKKWGDFENWIAAGLKSFRGNLQFLDARDSPPFPDYATISGVIITGSHAMVTGQEVWSERLAAWIPGLISEAIPLLGICYGHQLIAHAMGGTIGYHPRGRETGTTDINLHNDAGTDPLFHAMPEKFPAHTVHAQSILKMPPGGIILASNSFEPHHAIRIGKCAWGVQFHPEFNARIMQGYINHLAADLMKEKQSPERLRQTIKETTASHSLLEKFGQLAASGGI